MEEDIQNYSPTVMFRGTPFRSALKEADCSNLHVADGSTVHCTCS